MTQQLHPPAKEQLSAWRHDFHRHPETAFAEHRTSARLAELLTALPNLTVHTGWGRGTGIVAALPGRLGHGPAIGLRADIDALDVVEQTDLPYQSTTPGKMHACGHDGHMTMLLGAAHSLAHQPDFAGTIYFIFQPAEENEGGAQDMVQEGLFERFPMDGVYALHNWPGLPVGEAAVNDTAVMAAFDLFDLTLVGRGCHAAMPHLGTDTILAASQFITQLQGIIAREIPPHDPAVLSVTSIHAGENYNVIPESVHLRGTLRCFDAGLREQLQKRFRETVDQLATYHDLQAQLDYQPRYPATINDSQHAQYCVQALQAVPGIREVHRNVPPSMGSEDFSFMLEQAPGAYIWLGNGEDSAPLHNPRYDFNDELLPIGVHYWLSLVHVLLGAEATN
ncbi:MAG TPA: M20 aminoacylase family protein [Paenalcaligenes sp.]|nr:M20 aminoacylase family protein [Paenalcaligenes sp.]